MRAGLSLARGGGKTGLASALCLDAIRPWGVLHSEGFEAVLIASSFGQAQHKVSGARLRVVGSDNRRAHGWRVNLVIGDEPAQWGPRGELLAAAIRTALGKRAGARALFIGTRPSSDAHFFSRLLAEADESVYSQVHAASTDSPPFQVATWQRANPGLNFGLPAREVLKAEARLAKRNSAELATFRALRLNQGTSEVETQHLVDAETWRAVEVNPLPPAEGPCAWGIDLGGTAAFSAVACFWPRTGRLEGFVACGSSPSLAERALNDSMSGVYELGKKYCCD